jgi:hypothetical protein
MMATIAAMSTNFLSSLHASPRKVYGAMQC